MTRGILSESLRPVGSGSEAWRTTGMGGVRGTERVYRANPRNQPAALRKETAMHHAHSVRHRGETHE